MRTVAAEFSCQPAIRFPAASLPIAFLENKEIRRHG
jgi:hypothetical protein